MDPEYLVDTLNDLIETSKDGEYGFQASAECTHDPGTREVLLARSRTCREAASELQELVSGLGGKAQDSGTAGGAVHRGWVAVKGALTGITDLAILEDAERAEDNALAHYRRALRAALPVDIRILVERQLADTQRSHDRIRSLCELVRVD